MVLLHGQSDATVSGGSRNSSFQRLPRPVHCAEWLQNQIPRTVLHQIPDAEHGGVELGFNFQI